MWCRVSVSTLKHRPTGRARASPSSDTCSSTHLCVARECSRGSRYSITVSVERVDSLNERLSHHCVVRRQRPNTQTPRYGPRARVPKLRYMLVHAPRLVARRAPAGAVILLQCSMSLSCHQMNDCPITVWCGGNVSLLKHRSAARVHV